MDKVREVLDKIENTLFALNAERAPIVTKADMRTWLLDLREDLRALSALPAKPSEDLIYLQNLIASITQRLTTAQWKDRGHVCEAKVAIGATLNMVTSARKSNPSAFDPRGEGEKKNPDRGSPLKEVREAHHMGPDVLAVKLETWANCLYGRYGAPVYLVGSSLRGGGNDVDIRIIIPYDEYYARWPKGHDDPAWAREMGKQGAQGAKWARANIDLQVQNDVEAIEYKDMPRLRLDTTEANSPSQSPPALPSREGEGDAYG